MHTCTCTCMHIQLQVWCKICLFLLQTAKLESMQAKMKTVAMNHEKDIRKRESEVYTCTSLSLTHTHPPPPPLPPSHSLSLSPAPSPPLPARDCSGGVGTHLRAAPAAELDICRTVSRAGSCGEGGRGDEREADTQRERTSHPQTEEGEKSFR